MFKLKAIHQRRLNRLTSKASYQAAVIGRIMSPICPHWGGDGWTFTSIMSKVDSGTSASFQWQHWHQRCISGLLRESGGIPHLSGASASPYRALKVKVKIEYSCQWNSISQLRSVTCHIGSHNVTCHPTQVNTPHLNPSQTGRYSIYLPRRDRRLSWPSCSTHFNGGGVV